MKSLKIKGFSLYLSSLLAALTCPCHLPIYLFLFSGTSVGAFFTDNQWFLFVTLGLSFPLFALLALVSYRSIKAKHLSDVAARAQAIKP